MRKPHPDSEEALENAALTEIFDQLLGWETLNAYSETLGEDGTLGRASRETVILTRHLRTALQKLNPDVPEVAIDSAIEELSQNRSTQTIALANQETYQRLKDGIKVTYRDEDNEEQLETLCIIDWNNPNQNHFLMVSQLWVSGEYGNKRADLVGFVNGLPLVFIELKAHHKKLELAYKKNLQDYKTTIPQLFHYNALIILSNGSQSMIGSVTASWDHFSQWKKISDETESGVISLDTIAQGTCEKSRLLDLVENYTFFYTAKGSLIKIVAKNHQFLGVNQAIQSVREIQHNQGRLGVFWHTQGSGKSYSMVFFCQKILRKIPGNWTFLVITDREDLDDQIYKNFANASAVTEPDTEVRASNAQHLKKLLQENHRYVFTLIQKFRTAPGETYPQLSDRSNIIVIADEAHRSQYDTFALNLRNALPNAAFIGFTGTPLLDGEERTREVFGDYVSIYNFRQSVEDGATVPLFYENRIPELQLANDELNENMEQIIEAATLDEDQEKDLERQCSREYQLIVRDDRLEKIAQDIVQHFSAREPNSKAMIIAIDRFTAVKMYDKVRKYWDQAIDKLKQQLQTHTAGNVIPINAARTARDGSGTYSIKPNAQPSSIDEVEHKRLERQLRVMEATDMAVIISASHGELEAFQKKGLDIAPHRKRIVHENPGLDEQFKSSDSPLRLVFVCAMWMTGFDVPSCSTIYLDKPMRNHTLMQTIARANRVFQQKQNGLIVDYIGVFRNLEKALAIYGASANPDLKKGDTPVQDKSKQIAELQAIGNEALAFCQKRGIDFQKIDQTQNGLVRTKLWDAAVDAILENDDTKQTYFSFLGQIARLYDAICPDVRVNQFTRTKFFLERLAEKIHINLTEIDVTDTISDVMEKVEDLLDDSILAGEFVINASDYRLDLTKLNFDVLAAKFGQGQKNTEAEKLRNRLQQKVQQMVKLNRTRIDYLERFQKMIDDYNMDSCNIETYFRNLLEFAQSLKTEDCRKIAEGLTEEELVIFDLLIQPHIKLTNQEITAIKQIAQDLLHSLKQEKLVLDWRKRQQSKASVEVTIRDMLDALPKGYSNELYDQICQTIYEHVYESYAGAGVSIYSSII
jgi:type I restriction enzyme, R subunit